ncbi:MAG: amidohydrolase [Candidatus Baldrarchaeia archaeon]
MDVDAEKGCFADLVLINGEIITLDDGNTIYEGVAVKNGKIIEVGSNSEVKYWIGNKTRVIDLNGKAVVPGFIDSHTHFVGMGLKFTYIDFYDTKSLKDALELIKKEAEKKGDNEWIIGSNWDESKWIENRYPTRWDLDKATPNKPVYIVRICGHMAVTNTLGLKLLNIPKDTRGFEIDKKRGEPTGILKEDALEYTERVLKPSVNECLKGVKLAVDYSLKCGVTSVQDTVMSNHFSAYQIAMLENQLKVRIYTLPWYTNLEYLTALGLRSGFGNNWLKIGGIKLMADGSIGARTAALMEPYNDDPSNKGMILIEEDDLAEIIKKANENGLQVAAHAIGDRAIETLLNAFEKASKGINIKNRRHRIEHLELPTEDQIDRMRKLGLIASMQPNFVAEWGMPNGMYEQRFGKERWRRNNPFKLVLEKGVVLAFGSDCMPFGPIYGIWSAVNHPVEESRLSVEEALRAYTRGSAYAAFEEEIKGSIEIGKLADMTVLTKNPFKTSPKNIRDIRIFMTIVDGKLLYKA